MLRQNNSQQLSLLYNQKKIGSQIKYQLSSQQANLQKHLTAYEKEVKRRQQLQNQRLQRRISEIHRRKSSLSHNQEEQQKRLYTLNMVSRRLQREKLSQNLQQQNDVIVERIVRMRSYNSQLSKSQQRRKGSNRSLLLPKIEQYQMQYGLQ